MSLVGLHHSRAEPPPKHMERLPGCGLAWQRGHPGEKGGVLFIKSSQALVWRVTPLFLLRYLSGAKAPPRGRGLLVQRRG